MSGQQWSLTQYSRIVALVRSGCSLEAKNHLVLSVAGLAFNSFTDQVPVLGRYLFRECYFYRLSKPPSLKQY
jgi:hypothetical protein